MPITDYQATSSLGLKLQVTNGLNQIQRNVGSYSALYMTAESNISQVSLELVPTGVYTSDSTQTFSLLIISTNVALTLTINGVSREVNRVCVLDSSINSFTLTNVGTVKALVSINTVSTTI